MKYAKYHGLGNDYLVIRPDDVDGELESKQVQLICHRNYGVGSDGVLLGPLPSDTCNFRLRILNPDGSEAEKSGNGLRIFSRFLYDQGLVHENPFTVETLDGTVVCIIKSGPASQSPGRSLLALIMGQAKEISQLFFRASFPRQAIIYPVLNTYSLKH